MWHWPANLLVRGLLRPPLLPHGNNDNDDDNNDNANDDNEDDDNDNNDDNSNNNEDDATKWKVDGRVNKIASVH
jgi:hypothetical protein